MAGFHDIIGHEQIIEHLKNAINLNKISHAYIFNGEKDAGKFLIANNFAMALQCEGDGVRPCMNCTSCKKAISRNHPDIIRVTHEKPNTISVDDIREQLVNDIQIKPYSSPYKVYIIKDAQKMTVQAQNAMLKTIEEPPSYGVILLLTTNAETFLPTILSRCVTLNLKVIPDEKIKEHLMEQLQVPDYQADICTAFAQGNMGRAIKLASSENFHEIKDHALHLLQHIGKMELYELIEAVKSVSEFKLEITEYLDIILIWYRDVLLFKATNDINALVFKDQVNYIKDQANKSSYEGIEDILEAIERSKSRLKANVNFDLAMELLFLTIKENS